MQQHKCCKVEEQEDAFTNVWLIVSLCIPIVLLEQR